MKRIIAALAAFLLAATCIFAVNAADGGGKMSAERQDGANR